MAKRQFRKKVQERVKEWELEGEGEKEEERDGGEGAR